MSVIQPVILSGGSGTRLWPASRAMYPKQLLPLTSERTMLQETALRLHGKGNASAQTLVICNDAHRFLVAEQLRAIGAEARIVLEPEGRNTAPAVALAALIAIQAHEGSGAMQARAGTDTPQVRAGTDTPQVRAGTDTPQVRAGTDASQAHAGTDAPLLLVMPADHVIRKPDAFLAAIAAGEPAAADGKLVMFGVAPSYPHTGYGYIEADAKEGEAAPIVSFVEKPALKKAVMLLETNRFFWNSGIFLFRADTYLDELQQFAPEMVAACREALDGATTDADFMRPDAEAFRKSPSDSIDYAVMEKTSRGAMVPMTAGWSDVGSWAALHDVSRQDEDGNAIFGDVVAHNCKKSYISSASRLVTAVGLDNVIVVEDKDSVLVTHKDQAQDVKKVVERLEADKRPETRLHRQVFRPWGSYDSTDAGDGFQVKRLIVRPGAELSLQKHARRAEHWVVVQGTATITRDDDVFDLSVNEYVHIPIGAVHRIANNGPEPVHIVEVQCGDYLGEDDIVRLEDNYGRQGTTT